MLGATGRLSGLEGSVCRPVPQSIADLRVRPDLFLLRLGRRRRLSSLGLHRLACLPDGMQVAARGVLAMARLDVMVMAVGALNCLVHLFHPPTH